MDRTLRHSVVSLVLSESVVGLVAVAATVHSLDRHPDGQGSDVLHTGVGRVGQLTAQSPGDQLQVNESAALAAARALALRDDEDVPGVLGAVVTTHGQALATSGSRVDSVVEQARPVLVVALIGHFRHNGPVPHGVAAPTGEFLTLTWDLADHTVLDLGIMKQAPDLAALGAVTVPPLPPLPGPTP